MMSRMWIQFDGRWLQSIIPRLHGLQQHVTRKHEAGMHMDDLAELCGRRALSSEDVRRITEGLQPIVRVERRRPATKARKAETLTKASKPSPTVRQSGSGRGSIVLDEEDCVGSDAWTTKRALRSHVNCARDVRCLTRTKMMRMTLVRRKPLLYVSRSKWIERSDS